MDGGVTRTRAMRWSAPGWRSTVLQVAASTLLGAAIPAVRRSMQWPAGRRRRRVVAVVAGNALAIFAAGHLGHRMRAERDAAAARARARLGREPTESEVLFERFGRPMLRETLGREPTDAEVERVQRRGADA